VNLLPWLEGQAGAPARRPFYWRFGAGGSQFAVRDGDLKRVKVGADEGLFDVRQDICEKDDLKSARGAQAKDLERAWQQWNKDNVQVRPAGGKANAH
jgi:hypothetical protein